MATGTVDDIIADVTQLSNDMAAALNTLNAKIDSQVSSLQNQINNIQPSGTGGITTTPTNPTVASGSTQASVIATLAAPLLTNPTYSIVNSSGRYQISGNQLQVGAVAIDIANGTTDTVTVKALGSDGVSSITATLNLTVGPPGAPIVVDHNFVTAYYNTGGLTDWANTQTATLTETWQDGHSTTFNPNTVRRTDLGIWCVGQPTSFLGLHSEDASSWSTTGDASWVNFSSTDLGVQSSGFHAIRWSSSNNANGPISPGPINEAIAIGDVIHVKIRCRDPADASAAGGLEVFYRVGGAGTVANAIAHIPAGNMGGTAAIPSGQIIADDTHCQIVGSTLNSDGTYDIVLTYTAQAAYTSGQFEIVLATQTQTTGQNIDFHGMQITKGTADYPWTPTTTTIVTNPADALTYADPSGIFAAAQGFVVVEVQQCDHATLGTGGITGSAAGQFAKIGSTELLAPSGPAAFTAMNSAATALGLGGFRGIVRMCLTWDNTANSNAGLWNAYANGGKVATGTGAVGAAGVVAMMSAITGRLRRFTGGKTTLTTAQAQQMSELWNRTFINPGTALVPGSVTQTFLDDFDVNSLQTIPGGFTGTYAAPYNGPAGLAAAYAPSADSVHLWKPRYHFYTHDQYGEGTDQINGELQEYLDPQGPGNYVTITFSNSCMVGYTQQTSALTTAQQANVVNNPQTSGVKYPYVSWCMTTFGSDDSTSAGGGFNQQFGVFNCRAKWPAHKASWPAFWLYDYNDTSELDIEEYYGDHPTQITTAMHTDNFANNQPWSPPYEMGYDISQDFHDWTAVWVKGQYTKYFDGEQVKQAATITDFDNKAKFLVLNCAVQSEDTDAAGKAAMPWLSQVDRVRVFQFGA